jgi:hypothetical protein
MPDSHDTVEPWHGSTPCSQAHQFFGVELEVSSAAQLITEHRAFDAAPTQGGGGAQTHAMTGVTRISIHKDGLVDL